MFMISKNNVYVQVKIPKIAYKFIVNYIKVHNLRSISQVCSIVILQEIAKFGNCDKSIFDNSFNFKEI